MQITLPCLNIATGKPCEMLATERISWSFCLESRKQPLWVWCCYVNPKRTEQPVRASSFPKRTLFVCLWKHSSSGINRTLWNMEVRRYFKYLISWRGRHQKPTVHSFRVVSAQRGCNSWAPMLSFERLWFISTCTRCYHFGKCLLNRSVFWPWCGFPVEYLVQFGSFKSRF